MALSKEYVLSIVHNLQKEYAQLHPETVKVTTFQMLPPSDEVDWINAKLKAQGIKAEYSVTPLPAASSKASSDCTGAIVGKDGAHVLIENSNFLNAGACATGQGSVLYLNNVHVTAVPEEEPKPQAPSPVL